jgi:hypothetical protein
MKAAGVLLIAFNLFVNIASFSQAAAPIVSVCSLPAVINESSGIEKTGPNTFWSHNDSGGQPDIYKFDSSGTLLKTLTISNATNIDWEDIAEDNLGNFYIGDFGNNNNNRSVANSNGLKIYKITDPDLIAPNSTTAAIINFEYVDRNFSAPSTNHNFDMEGFFFFNDSLHLFTKNRTSPTNGWIKHYILPSTPGTFTAMVVDSFNNGGVRITSADISPNYKTVALLAQNNIWLFSCYKGSKFLSTGSSTVLTLPNTQKEAIVFSNDTVVYITDELTSPVGQKLYRSNLKAAINKPILVSGISSTVCPGNTNGQIIVTPTGGSGVYTYSWSNSAVTATNAPIGAGSYSVTVTDSKGCVNKSAYVVSNHTVALVVITQTNTTLNSSSASGNQWYLNGNAISGATAASFNYTVNGNYYVMVTDVNGCTVLSNTLNINSGGVGISELTIEKSVVISYQGSDYTFTNTTDFYLDFELSDVLGRVLFTGRINAGGKVNFNSERMVLLMNFYNKDNNYLLRKRIY